QNVPDDMLGRIMSFYSAIVSVALPIGILLYGYLYEKFINHLPVIMFLTALQRYFYALVYAAAFEKSKPPEETIR
ncbi:MAG: hypothetical protein K2N95_06930, partial [Lachnospiraceae bacterium]|nr:hypothetical protein [Lachnospiraceae bacterium]